MIKQLLKKIGKNNKVKTFFVPDDMRVYCIGDIHGRIDLLIELQQLIINDSEQFSGQKIVVYLGDYIDRGLQSKQVVDHLITQPLDGFESIYLRGNHEQVLLDFLNVDPGIATQWFNFGGQATLLSYEVTVSGIPFGENLVKLQQDLADKISQEHLDFFIQTQYFYQLGDYFFVHAGVKPKVTLDRQSCLDMMWIRDEFLQSQFRFEKMIVHGHTMVEEPEQKKNRIAIDTAAYISGRLTSLVLEGQERRFLQTGA